MHGASGDIACDGYHKYKEDVQLMKDMGWKPIGFPYHGHGLSHWKRSSYPKGLQYYNNLINELISHGYSQHPSLMLIMPFS
ncbi:hydroxyisourate hydrolase [Quercus suber]|uniref:Hydroxyisourate hydrolase n=1 Tax=Quercus suber TaxID=58331 RepID=A0AAW0KWF6_QUESU